MDGILSERQNVAVKDYNCTICGGLILKGEGYTRAYWRPEWQYVGDKPIDGKFCSRCYIPAHLPRDGSDGYDSIRRHYGVPARLGMKVFCRGTHGTLLRGDLTDHAYLVVQVAGMSANRPEFWHPTYQVVYYNEDGSIAADYRKRPQEATA